MLRNLLSLLELSNLIISVMHALRWIPHSCTINLCNSSNPRKTSFNTRWVPETVTVTSTTFSSRYCIYLRRRTHKVWNALDQGDGETPPGDEENSLLSELVEGEVEKLLKSEENQALLKDLASAVKRVSNAREELNEIEQQENDAAKVRAYIEKLEGTDSMIADCMREVSEAEAKMRKAELALITARSGSIQDLSNKWEEADIDQNAERIESIRAMSVSALVGTLASIPIALFEAKSIGGLFVREGIIFISCALFGVTYRYTVRRNLDNVQLKTGTVAAFGLVRGLSQFEAGLPVDFDMSILLSHALDVAFMVGEGILVFISAAIALDYCMKDETLKS